MGKPIFRFIPMKVPLGPSFNSAVDPHDRFTVQDAKRMAKAKLQGIVFDEPVVNKETGEPTGEVIKVPAVADMVIDLTNSKRYYRLETFEEDNEEVKGKDHVPEGLHGYRHVKIPNRGRGEVPDPEAVSDFCFEVFSHLNANPHSYILVHCTHGFNRTGFMIASYMMRALADPSTRVEKALAAFTDARSPGIYKDYYIKYLYRYYHGKPPSTLQPPPLPPWKAVASPDDGDGDDEGAGALDGPELAGAVGRGLRHDDPIGEKVSKSEGDWVRGLLQSYVLGRSPDNPHGALFPGSQPVSLARANLSLLNERRYWVTWKADGTRYLLFLHPLGTYLIDRSNVVTRVQMRWPRPIPPWRRGDPPPPAPVGPFHVGSLLDGEMVVDVDSNTGLATRRFLAYDMVMINGMAGLNAPWGERWEAIKKFVLDPRHREQAEATAGRWRLRYDYSAEPFRFRRKDFWPLTAARKVVREFIPSMRATHPVDGLILQPHDDPYVPLTCQELLKWKFADMNSVDFLMRMDKEDRPTLALLCPKGGRTFSLEVLEGAAVYFPKAMPDDPESGMAEGQTPFSFNGKIIECAWDGERQAWRFMRQRFDKTTPNAKQVYELVVQSIKDDINADELLGKIDTALEGAPYDADMGRQPRTAAGGEAAAGAAQQQH
jgi:mRNA-capping enzyme